MTSKRKRWDESYRGYHWSWNNWKQHSLKKLRTVFIRKHDCILGNSCPKNKVTNNFFVCFKNVLKIYRSEQKTTHTAFISVNSSLSKTRDHSNDYSNGFTLQVWLQNPCLTLSTIVPFAYPDVCPIQSDPLPHIERHTLKLVKRIKNIHFGSYFELKSLT